MAEKTGADEKVEYVHNRIREALYDGLDGRWDEVLTEWDEASSRQQEMIRRYVSGIRERAWSSLSEIRSIEELEQGLAIQYIELKARWTMLNTQIQSQTEKYDSPDDGLIYRATCVSLIVQALEPLLRQEQIDTLTDRLNRSVQEDAQL